MRHFAFFLQYVFENCGIFLLEIFDLDLGFIKCTVRKADLHTQTVSYMLRSFPVAKLSIGFYI